MTITPTTLFRAAGVAAIAAGVIFIGVQINHPPSEVSSVTTTEWVVRNSLKVLMAALALVGITGMAWRTPGRRRSRRQSTPRPPRRFASGNACEAPCGGASFFTADLPAPVLQGEDLG